jgi:DNA-binding beta-propeller fold protein YncE
VADPCLPFPRNPHYVPDLKPDQSKRFLPLLTVLGAVLGLALTSCGGEDGSGSAAAIPVPHAMNSIDVGGAPVAVGTGEGGVWVVDNAGSRVVELNPASGRVLEGAISVGAGSQAIAVGEGYVWVASGDGTVTRVDPKTGGTRRATTRIADPGGIAAGEGSVWITNRASGTVTTIDPKSLTPGGKPIAVGDEPADIALGDGAAWVANTADGTVTRIDAATGEADTPIPVAEFQVLGLCFGEGGVWVAKTDDRLARRIEVVRIDPDSSAVGQDAASIPAAIPVRLAAGEGGVWATLVGGVRPPATNARPGQVALLDPADLTTPVNLTRVGERPAGIAVGDGAVWAANSGDGTVTRIGL